MPMVWEKEKGEWELSYVWETWSRTYDILVELESSWGGLGVTNEKVINDVNKLNLGN